MSKYHAESGYIENLADLLTSRIAGQSAVIPAIVDSFDLFQSGLAAPDRPLSVLLLLGPTGTGKTRTVEALAEILHGSRRNLLKIDCGEFQMEHEVAKLIGAPPGYLGHRETNPLLSQQKLTSVTTDECGLAIVLFDEIEKAAPSLVRLLLGVLDRGVLRLGDNTSVDFEKTIIFMTSNLGAKEIARVLRPAFGFQPAAPSEVAMRIEAITRGAVKKKFSPEFVNRIDHLLIYETLDEDSIRRIVDMEVEKLEERIEARLAHSGMALKVPAEARKWLARKGTSPEYGARELKRTINRNIIKPMAGKVIRKEIRKGSTVTCKITSDDRMVLKIS